MEQEHSIVKKLNDYLANASEEQLKKDWEELEQYNQDGPDVSELLDLAKKKLSESGKDICHDQK